MKKAFALALLAAACGAQAEPFMKAGLWEMRTLKHLSDGKDMTAQIAASQAKMQEMMAKMSPQQRQQMEQMMGKSAANPADPGVTRMCVSAEMAARDQPVMPKDSNCEIVKFNRSGNTTTFENTCRTEGSTVVGKGESVRSGDTISTKMELVSTGTRGNHTTQMETQMKFVGADCGGLKPIDQIAREMQGQANQGRMPK
jgi:hypothetical protein